MKGSEDIALIGFLCLGEGASDSLDRLLGGFLQKGEERTGEVGS